MIALSSLLATSIAGAQTAEAPSPQATAAEENYAAVVREFIKRNMHVIPGLDMSSYTGGPVVALTIGKDGELLHASVSENSGLLVLDDTARRAVMFAAPFPSIPKAVGRDTMDIRVRFDFNTPAE